MIQGGFFQNWFEKSQFNPSGLIRLFSNGLIHLANPVFRLQVITITTKIPEEMDQIIASFYLQYLYNQMISIRDIVSSSFVIFALNVLYQSKDVDIGGNKNLG